MRQWTLGMALLGALLLASALPAGATLYPNRWVRIATSLREDHEVERIQELAGRAARHGLTGIVLSAGLDQLDLKPPDFLDRLRRVRQAAEAQGLELIPSFLSAGYGGSVLAHNRNLAAGLPVRDALFVVQDGRTRLVPDPSVGIDNGGFERKAGRGPEGFQISQGSADSIAVDEGVFRTGRASLRFSNLDQASESWVRISRGVKVRPFRQYRLSAWVRTEGLPPSNPFGSANFLLEVLGGEERRPLQYENPQLSGSGRWEQVTVGFNSSRYEQVEIAPKVRGGLPGTVWLDDLQLEEVGLVNVLRRPGTPLEVRSERSSRLYAEGTDYRPVADPHLNFRYDHEGPGLELLPGSRIQEGDRLRVSYYHGVRIFNGQTPVCLSEPELYQIWATQVRLVHEHLAPRKYLLSMDEVRAGGSCLACQRRGLSMGEILGDCLTRQLEMIRQGNPAAEVFVWSDMLDPHHNADPRRNYYYLVDGNFAGSWRHIPPEMVILCWSYSRRYDSLRHFSSLGFRTLAGAYYDADDLENVRGWLDALKDTPGATGILYTTWLNKYDLLEEFGDLVSGTR